MKEVIKMKEPIGLPNHIAVVIAMEDSEFCKMLSTAATTSTVTPKQTASTTFRSASLPGSGQMRRQQMK